MNDDGVKSFFVLIAPAKFSYRPGQTYSYDYKIQTETSMDGASEERAGLSITGQADIEVIDTCEMVLKVSRSRRP